MSGCHDHGRGDRGRDHHNRDDRGRHDNRGQDRHRSRSPRHDSRDFQLGYGQVHRERRQDGPRGSYGPRGGSKESIGTANTALGYPPLPISAPLPDTGAKVPYRNPVTKDISGRKATVFVNHHVVETLPIIKIFQYDLRFRVPESSQARGSDKVTASQMARVLLNTTLTDFLGTHFVFDGVSLGWSPKELMAVGQSRSTTISLGKRRDDKPNEVEIFIRNSGTLNIGALVSHLQSGEIGLNLAGNHIIEPVLKWLNALVRSDPEKSMISKRNSNAFYHRSKETSAILHSTGGILEALRGIFQTVQIRFSRLTLNVDTATTPFWCPDKPLIECVCALTGERSPQNVQKSFIANPSSFFGACNMLLGIYFNVRHLDDNKNNKKMKFMSWSARDAISTTFDEPVKDGTTRSISVVNYFENKHNIKLLYPRLPLVHSKNGDFPLELCFTTSGEKYKSVLQGPAALDYIKFATAPAFMRRRYIDANLRILAWHEKQTLLAHGISVSPAMLKVEAVVLQSPKLIYGQGSIIQPTDGQWNLRGLRLLKPASIKSWALICFSAQADKLDNIGHELIHRFRDVGLCVPNRAPSILIGNPQGNIETVIRDSVAKAQRDFGSAPDLILIILKASSVPMYAAIKQALDIGYGIASQGMVAEKVFKGRGLAQYLANISLKVNVKLGGTNCTVDQKLFKQERWMLIGGDTSMASPSALRQDPPPPITASLCGTWDRDCIAYTTITSMQQNTDVNCIVHASVMFKELLKRYASKNNGLLPERIIYYRDGASESEFLTIRDKEGIELRRLCQKSGTKITIVVAIKRHHTRFFAQDDIATKLGNVPPGTVVAENSPRNDAFIIAHRDLQGTKRPIRYVCIVDENNLSADVFYRLTYELCSTYARATTSVAVVPPIYYAHQACERARIHLQDKSDGTQFLPQVHDNLKWNMYWQ